MNEAGVKEKIKVTLIAPCGNISLNGLRQISSYLKQNKHRVDLIFLPSNNFSALYPKKVFDDLCSLCEDSDLIGFSLMTNYFISVRDLTIRLKKKLDIPIIWGGIHPTVKPEECLAYADMVCIGEGEEAILELANKLKSGNVSNIKNIWFKKNNEIIKNNVRSLEENLDKYPFQDYDISTHYFLRDGKIVKMTSQLLEYTMPKNAELGKFNCEYSLMSTRGCPYNCSYCCNNALRKIYNGKGKFVRKRGINNIVEEIELIINKFQFIKQILITDDTFFIRDKEEIQEFCSYYKKKIGLPIRCYVSPLEMEEDKLKLMIDAGLFRISVGIQSYCEQTLINIYNRHTPKNVILNSIRIIDKYRSKLPNPRYHIIVDNPYETKESKKENIELISLLPKGSRVTLFALVLYPGTDLYEKANRDGLIRDEINEIYLKSFGRNDIKNWDYLTCLLYAYYRYIKINKKIIKLLLNNKIIIVFDNKFFLFLANSLMNLISTLNLFFSQIARAKYSICQRCKLPI